MGIIAILLKYKTLLVYGLLAVLFVGMGLHIKTLNSDNKLLESKIVNLGNLLTDSQGTVKQLQNDISTQNQAVEDLKTTADAKKKDNAALVKKAQDSADSYKKRADDLLKRIVPQTVNRCDAANILINEEIKNAKK